MVQYIHPVLRTPLIEVSEGLAQPDGTVVFPCNQGVFRVATEQNYTDSFGFEWSQFHQTQLDSFSGTNISKKRFFATTRWGRNMKDQNILEVGCGAGRFTEIVLKNTHANLYALDYSNAVDANYRNNGPHNRLKLFQADMFQMPFADNSFDKIFCFGVLQHTPDFKRALECMVRVLKPGGELVIDFYPVKGWYTTLNAKYLLRPLLRKMDHRKILALIRRMVPGLKRMYFFNKRNGMKWLNRFLPICEMPDALTSCLSNKEIEEWMVLDTFDMFSPVYDKPRRSTKVRQWFVELDLIHVEAENVQYDREMEAAVVRGTKA